MGATNMELVNDQKNPASRQSDDDTEEIGCGCWASKRYFLTATLFMGAFSMHSLGDNVSISIIEMTENRTAYVGNRTIQYGPEFEWDSQARGLVLSMFGYGFLTAIIAAPIVRRLGAVTSYGYALLLAGVVTILNPHIVRFNFYLFLMARFLEGFLVTVCYVANADILSRWSSKGERSTMVSIVTSGTSVGTVVTFPMCGLLARYWGWPSTFYCTGAITVVISFILILTFHDDPSQDKYISKKELKMLISEAQDPPNEEIAQIWKGVLRAKPLWALVIASMAFACGSALIGVCLPTYVRDMTGLEVHLIGFLSSVPNAAAIFSLPVAGLVADYVQNSRILSASQVHKTYTTVGFVFGAMCLFAVSSISNFTINIILLVIFEILISLDQLMIFILPLYMAPRHSGFITAIASCGYSIGFFITPMLMGYIVTSHDPAEWSTCLTTVGTIMLLSSVVFLSFGSSEVLDILRAKPQPENGENKEALL